MVWGSPFQRLKATWIPLSPGRLRLRLRAQKVVAHQSLVQGLLGRIGLGGTRSINASFKRLKGGTPGTPNHRKAHKNGWFVVENND